MKRSLVIVFVAASAVGCPGISTLSTPLAVGSSASSAEVFANIADGSLFGACLQSVELAQVHGVSFTKACTDAFGKVGAQAVSISADCEELSGRASEAASEGFLGDGRLLCGRLMRERALATSQSLAHFAPSEGTAPLSAFCDVMKDEALQICAVASVVVGGSSSTAVAVEPSIMPATAVLPVRTQTPALRSADAKAVRLVPEPVVAPQMSEAAQTIAAGMWPAFTRQVPQALAAGLPATAPMNTKAGQQPDLNNGGIWTNLAALLHRTG